MAKTAVEKHLAIRVARYNEPDRKVIPVEVFTTKVKGLISGSVTVTSNPGTRKIFGSRQTHLGTDISSRGRIHFSFKKGDIIRVTKSMRNFTIHVERKRTSVLINFVTSLSPKLIKAISRAGGIPVNPNSQSKAFRSKPMIIVSSDNFGAKLFSFHRSEFVSPRRGRATGPHVHIEIVNSDGQLGRFVSDDLVGSKEYVHSHQYGEDMMETEWFTGLGSSFITVKDTATELTSRVANSLWDDATSAGRAIINYLSDLDVKEGLEQVKDYLGGGDEIKDSDNSAIGKSQKRPDKKEKAEKAKKSSGEREDIVKTFPIQMYL